MNIDHIIEAELRRLSGLTPEDPFEPSGEWTLSIGEIGCVVRAVLSGLAQFADESAADAEHLRTLVEAYISRER